MANIEMAGDGLYYGVDRKARRKRIKSMMHKITAAGFTGGLSLLTRKGAIGGRAGQHAAAAMMFNPLAIGRVIRKAKQRGEIGHRKARVSATGVPIAPVNTAIPGVAPSSAQSPILAPLPSLPYQTQHLDTPAGFSPAPNSYAMQTVQQGVEQPWSDQQYAQYDQPSADDQSSDDVDIQ